jgi:integrase
MTKPPTPPTQCTEIAHTPPKRGAGRLIWTGAGYSVRFGNRGKLIPLGTDDKRVANARRTKLATDPEARAAAGLTPPSTTETFAEAARRLVQVQLDADVPSAPARASRLERWAIPELGTKLITEVRPGHITTVLEHVAALGRSSTTLAHMRGDLIYVFGRLLKEEAITRNPARGELVDTPPGVDDPRPRVILRDDEFSVLVDSPKTPPQLRMMAIASRAVGGMRTSDLRAWRWDHLDVQMWQWADVPRPKTERGKRTPPGMRNYRLERLQLPPLAAAELATWWEASGRPADGPVFRFPPARKSFAADLRAALLAAGVDRHELHHNTDRTRRVDFHSFRRAWATAIGAQGLNAQTAMLVTGHKQMTTHMRYQRPEVISVPSGAVPTWGADQPTSDPVQVMADWLEPTHLG